MGSVEMSARVGYRGLSPARMVGHETSIAQIHASMRCRASVWAGVCVAGPAETRWKVGLSGPGRPGVELLSEGKLGRRASVYRFLCYNLMEGHWYIDTCDTQ